ncbi:hypothetical protein V8C35DRAFT_276390 [Trichoderma chlorosporum]
MPRTRITARARASTTTQTEKSTQVEQSTRSPPISLRNAPGNVLWDDNDMNGNVAGISSIAYAAVTMLDVFVNGKASDADLEEAKEMLAYIGGSETVNEFRNKLQQRVGTSAPVTTVFKNLFSEGR